MYLNKLCLVNFKNYSEAELNFSPGVNCFVGNNGMGKTNLLDAIHYLAFCKSYFNPVDSQNIKYDQPFFLIQGFFTEQEKTDEVTCGVKRNQKKQFKKNKKEYERLSDHIGTCPMVMITPSDAELIMGGSESRRKFIDGIISQYDKSYLEKLISYNHVLSQRNALLKQFQESGNFDSVALDIWDEQLLTYGEFIVKQRKEFLFEFIPLFNKNYAFISDSKEKVDLSYLPSLGEKDFKTALLTALPKDRILQFTTVGPHRDDLDFKLAEFSLRKFASQGQQKSFLLALKLAQYEFIKSRKGTNPLLLLDDVYDKLDEDRFKKLIFLVSKELSGQVFITDTHMERIQQLFKAANVSATIFSINDGIAQLIN